ncbi:hypothetical protein PXK30_04360 [Phaeobacter gallaeciensis]|jgi:hypothetical protein|uniref:hypothetical protein n=1 Tax=Phaeobacter gallaeciensis TaxID=60890 RepID=UPI00237EF928|nr:hypothetical protein [Phaeobacter gallaeciensis]MDE4273209.1 hypothetical protein [Phaeobacter gallaeciensis]MDE4298450.1 hypothetical protein [Phaeobacter gallaeciensis]MDE4310503.1 hypothetical protein [Phaeobacter gallaeciensis]MDE4314964.1 hypothetical protein [Phaeobacter gallaeciensis]MDE4319432.1 hypothetical protein [Phaeobacter gallaeciensis]
MPLKFLHVAAVMVAVTLIALPRNAMAETGPLLVELNKTEEIDGGGCRAFFLFRNQTGKSFAGFEMSLAILDAGGVIDRLLSVDAAPLPVQRTTLKLFEIPDIACSNISEILLHDITSCQPQNEEQMDCFPILRLESRAAAQLVK